MRREFVVKEGCRFVDRQGRQTGIIEPMCDIQVGLRGVTCVSHTFFRTHARERYGRVWTLLRSEP